MEHSIYDKSNAELVRELGGRFRDYRRRFGLTQREVAERTGLSAFTIRAFESGSATGLTLINLLKLLRSIESLEEIGQLLPALPDSPRLLYKAKRTRKKAIADHGE